MQQTATVTHGKGNEQKIAALERGRDNAKRQLELTEYHLTLMELKSPLNGVVNYLPNYSQGGRMRSRSRWARSCSVARAG